MHKLIAILNVVAWSGFWAFGYLALTADAADSAHVTTAVILAAAGGGIGLWAYFKLIRFTEATGYAKPRNRVRKVHLEEEAS
ncbi:hypothetical protein [Nereida sp. MMG025]|uniref:hypothetical protein n=1 Tax=Nereida sp. MMG025 TaxID=2909981 RepID=UPI001F465BCD|nr:hypothetical protein [Nereida sp. MMG025]MCF6444868.1 hypothetical protein [Nereida sp. MMG025]